MIDYGFTPNCYTYTVLMEHLAGSGKFHEVLEIFSKMQEAGVPPDKAACNILIGKCCEAGETWVMTKILQYMIENALVLRKPVYMEALKTLRIAGMSDSLLKQANRHISTQCNDEELTDDFCTTADINSIDRGLLVNFLTRRNFVAVDCLLTNMIEKNIKLDSDLITAVIEVYSANSRPDGALLAFELSTKMGLNFERTAYLSLLGLCIRTNLFSKAVEIVQEMVKAGIFLGTHLSALLIYRLGCARKPVCAAKVFDLLPEDEKSTTAYTALIAAYFASTNANEGLKMFKTMKDEGVPVALGTYNVLLAGLERSGRVLELELYRKEKKCLQTASPSEQWVSVEERTCNLLFARDVVFCHSS